MKKIKDDAFFFAQEQMPRFNRSFSFDLVVAKCTD